MKRDATFMNHFLLGCGYVCIDYKIIPNYLDKYDKK